MKKLSESLNESLVNEAKDKSVNIKTKSELFDLIKNSDNLVIILKNGEHLLLYSPVSNNDENLKDWLFGKETEIMGYPSVDEDQEEFDDVSILVDIKDIKSVQK